MSISCQAQNKAKTKWDEAIADAKRKIRRLEYTIAVYKKMKRSGDQWPGATQN
jgi:hypothetical protein